MGAFTEQLSRLLPWQLRIHSRLSALEVECIKLRTALEATLLDDTEAQAQAFNGQLLRQRLVEQLFAALHIASYVETGVGTGLTTAHVVRQHDCTVLGVESDPLLHRAACRRLAGTRARVDLASSARWLRDDAVRRQIAGPTLFYLDAHWEARSPLHDELVAIASFCRAGCVLIDDFAVPGDPGYGFDSEPEALTIDNFREMFLRLGFVASFPAAPSRQETGARRGCVVLFPAAQAVPEIPGLVADWE